MTKTPKASETFGVLLADDSEADRALMRDALRQHPRLALLGEARDGEEVIAYFSQAQSQSPSRPVPDLLLLDLRMPCRDGFEVLEWLQGQAFKKLLVVILAGSSRPEDFERSMALGAHAYYVKIPHREARLEMIRSIETLLLLSRQMPERSPYPHDKLKLSP